MERDREKVVFVMSTGILKYIYRLEEKIFKLELKDRLIPKYIKVELRNSKVRYP